MGAGSPDLVVAMRLVDHLKLHGFQLQRTAPGEDGPLVANRVSGEWLDLRTSGGFDGGEVDGFSRGQARCVDPRRDDLVAALDLAVVDLEGGTGEVSA
jgi:hypothetical protein